MADTNAAPARFSEGVDDIHTLASTAYLLGIFKPSSGAELGPNSVMKARLATKERVRALDFRNALLLGLQRMVLQWDSGSEEGNNSDGMDRCKNMFKERRFNTLPELDAFVAKEGFFKQKNVHFMDNDAVASVIIATLVALTIMKSDDDKYLTSHTLKDLGILGGETTTLVKQLRQASKILLQKLLLQYEAHIGTNKHSSHCREHGLFVKPLLSMNVTVLDDFLKKNPDAYFGDLAKFQFQLTPPADAPKRNETKKVRTVVERPSSLVDPLSFPPDGSRKPVADPSAQIQTKPLPPSRPLPPDPADASQSADAIPDSAIDPLTKPSDSADAHSAVDLLPKPSESADAHSAVDPLPNLPPSSADASQSESAHPLPNTPPEKSSTLPPTLHLPLTVESGSHKRKPDQDPEADSDSEADVDE